MAFLPRTHFEVGAGSCASFSSARIAPAAKFMKESLALFKGGAIF